MYKHIVLIFYVICFNFNTTGASIPLLFYFRLSDETAEFWIMTKKSSSFCSNSRSRILKLPKFREFLDPFQTDLVVISEVDKIWAVHLVYKVPLAEDDVTELRELEIEDQPLVVGARPDQLLGQEAERPGLRKGGLVRVVGLGQQQLEGLVLASSQTWLL